jgi:hypothetical protein
MAHKTILLKGDPLRKEAKANEAGIYPGMLIEYVTNDGTVRKHATDGGDAALMVAIEDSLQGKEVGDVYADGAQVQYVHLRPGDEFLAYAEAGTTLALGTYIESGGNGYFQRAEGDSSEGVVFTAARKAMALEAKAAGTAARVKALAV